MRRFQFFRKTVFQSFVAAVVGAALIAGLNVLPSIAAPEEQIELLSFVAAARSAQRVQDGDVLKREMEIYMWEDVYMMGEVIEVIEIPNDGGNDYQIFMSTARHQHPSHDSNIWLGGDIILLYWDAPPLFSVSEGDIVEFIATAVGFATYTSMSDRIVTVPLLEVTEFQEMVYPGSVEDAE